MDTRHIGRRSRARAFALGAMLAVFSSACGWFDVNGEPGRAAMLDGGLDQVARDGAMPPLAGSGAGGPSSGRDPNGGEGGGRAGESGASGEAPEPDSGGSGGREQMDPPIDAAIDDGCAGDAGCDDDTDGAVPNVPGLSGDFTWHPIAARFAVTDDPAWPGELDRAWLLVDGGATPRRLVSRALEAAVEGWLDTHVWGITSELDGVSFSDEQNHYQRVFFARDGALHVLRDDRPLADAHELEPQLDLQPIASSEGYKIDTGDLAAVAYTPASGAPRTFVLAPARFQGESGYYCLYEQASPYEAFHAQCSRARVVHDETELAGAVIGDEVHFYFRARDGGLYRIARDASGHLREDTLPSPGGRALAPSLWAMASELPGRVELLVVTADGVLWNARPIAAERDAPQWAQVTPIEREVRVSTGRAAIAAIVTDNHGSITLPDGTTTAPIDYTLTELRVIGDDGQHYFNATLSNRADRPWGFSWTTLALERDQRVHAIGGVTKRVVPFHGVYEFGAALTVAGGQRTTTLQEAALLVVYLPWRDHLRRGEPASLPPLAHVAELSVASGPDRTLAAVALRSKPPFEVALVESDDGATTFARTVRLPAAERSPSGHRSSVLEPSVGYGGGLMHVSTLEWDLTADCREPERQARRVIYRRGATAEQVAALAPGDPDVFIASGSIAQPSHPAMVVTKSALGPTAHVVFNGGTARELYYFRLAPGEAAPAEPIRLGEALPRGPAALAVGADEVVYAASYDAGRFAVCALGPEGIEPGLCSTPDPGLLQPAQRELAFGEPLALDDPIRERCVRSGDVRRRCLRDERPFSIAASKDVPHRIYVAFTAVEGDSTAVFITSSCGGESIGPASCSGRQPWLTPVRAHAADAARFYFDPEITVDGRGQLVLSYGAMTRSAGAATAHSFIARFAESLDQTLQLQQAPWTGSAWDPTSLGFDCTTGYWALGDYRQADTVNARTFHVVREGSQLTGRWLSELVGPSP